MVEPNYGMLAGLKLLLHKAMEDKKKREQKPIDIDKLAERYKDLPPVTLEEFGEAIKRSANPVNPKVKKPKKNG